VGQNVTPMRWPELVIFDCDGVLVDSETISLGATREALARAGLPLSEDEVLDRFLGISMQSMMGAAQRDLGAALPPAFQSDLANAILQGFERDLKGVDGIAEAVAGLARPVCVASSSSPSRIRASLTIAGTAHLFEPNVFSADEVENGKPAPDLFLHAARRMATDPAACLVIEDSVPGVIAARGAGMTVFGFIGGAHITGPRQAGRLSLAGAALIFSDMRQLPDLVARHRAPGAVAETR